ncbi:MAG: helix-turn-helix domain-containing protein [Corynebacterium provencense]|uniref:helix-turn-helix domain-containing protein n=1 Tax=Corynebacterium provencense TaxID=1737425 RepID=UPI002989AD9D|nr:helix-turn-helix domain-containing protein [Corynebacterium provencense]
MYTPPPDLDWKTYAAAVGYRVKTLRTDLELTQEALAERSGISRNQIQNIERGHGTGANGRVTNMSMEHVYRLAYALEVPPIVLLPDVEKGVSPRYRAAGHHEPMDRLMHRTIDIDVAWPRGARAKRPGHQQS